MTTTTLYQVESQIADLRREKATITNRVPLETLFSSHPERMAKFGIERIRQTDRDQAAWDAARMTEILAEIDRLSAIVAELEKVSCHRCGGTGQYHAPTSYYRGGIPVCFTCGGTGRRRGARA